jgi:tryptophanyl-tRNA synthetase
VPEPYIVKETAKIYDLADPTSKMSKSAASMAGVIDLLDDPKVTAKKIRSAVTDNEREIRYDPEHKPGVSSLLSIHSALSGRSIDDLEKDYAGKGYGDFKGDLADVVTAALTPFRDRTLELLADTDTLDKVLAEGAEKARSVAQPLLDQVYDAVGFLLPSASGR